VGLGFMVAESNDFGLFLSIVFVMVWLFVVEEDE
jgi:hypothetical protein